jgi:hypothetical protein
MLQCSTPTPDCIVRTPQAGCLPLSPPGSLALRGHFAYGTPALASLVPPHQHSATPPLDSPWCRVCSALLDWAILADECEVQL